jgi:AraC-like DNA-binding protein
VSADVANTLSDFRARCCDQPSIEPLTDPDSISLTSRVGQSIGPLSIVELMVGSDVSLHCGELCSAYRLTILHSGRLEPINRRAPVTARPGCATVYQPRGDTRSRWKAGTHMLAIRIDHGVVEDILSDVLGRRVTANIDLQPTHCTATGTIRSWLDMLFQLAEQAFAPDSTLTHPLVGVPYVDCLIRGLLLVADHPYREAVAAEPKKVAPQAVRVAVEIIEAEAHLPLTLSVLAARTYVSVRGLQAAFRRHLDTSPMAYLRDVRLRRAHEALQRSDPASDTVASVASAWGFTNFGRFAAAHVARYGESPVVTLHSHT